MDNRSHEWKKTGVWLCTKCFKGTSVAEDLKSDFKSRFKDLGLSKSIRVMTSSCLGVCPVDKQAVIIQKPGEPTEVYAMDPEAEKEKLFLKLSLAVKG